ncbi:hypothetical protein Trydic_g15315 [Trypoxylus dichotomus]
MAQPGTKATREARTAKSGISQKQHKAFREASKAKPSTNQKQEKATKEALEAQLGTSHFKATRVKRNLSDGSTPKAAVKRPKTNIETGKSYSGALTDIRMAIVPENYPECSISLEQAELIRNCILQELDKLSVRTRTKVQRGPTPGWYVEGRLCGRGHLLVAWGRCPKLRSLGRLQAETGQRR